MPGNIQDLPPPSVVASWPAPNYVDPVTRSWMPIYAGILQGATTVLVATRLRLRLLNKAGPIGLDDALLVPAYLAATMFTVVIIVGSVNHGNNRHIWDVPPDSYEMVAFFAWLSQLAFLRSTCATKASVLLFYRRLVKGTYSKKWKYATIAAIALTVCYCVAFIFALIFNCNPTEAYWKGLSYTYTRDWRCSDTTIANPLSGALSVCSDLYAVILPMGMLYKFDIERKKRIALYAVFSLGLLVVAAGSVRTYYLARLSYDYDLTWIGFDTYVWADLEVQLAIICASAPVLRVLFRQLRAPLTRAMNTASAGRSSKRDSGPPVISPISTVTTYVGDPKSQFHNATPSLEVLKECDVEVSPVHQPAGSYNVKDPAEYDAYALRNVDRHRSSRNWQGPVRQPSHTGSRPPEPPTWRSHVSRQSSVESSMPSEAAAGLKAVPRSLLDSSP